MINMDEIDCTKLRKIIDDKGFKHSWVAQQIGIDRSHLSCIINGRRVPGHLTLKVIMNVLKIKEKDLKRN